MDTVAPAAPDDDPGSGAELVRSGWSSIKLFCKSSLAETDMKILIVRISYRNK